jgi:fatty-acyl-CoA synthase
LRSSAERVFPQSILDALRSSPKPPAFEHGSRVVSRGELLETVRRLASGMRDAGLGPGHGVAMVTALTPEGFAANIAAHALGCRVVGVRPGWSSAQLADVLGAQIDAVVTDPSSASPELAQAAGRARLLSLGTEPVAGGLDPVADLSAADLLACTDDGLPITAEARAGDIARVNFTSGSTGRPKGCARTYRTLGLAYEPAHWAPGLVRLLARFERYLVFGGWSMPVMLTFAGRCLLTGSTVIIPDGDDVENQPAAVPRPLLPYAIERHRVTGTVTNVPRFYQMLNVLRDHRLDLSSLRAIVVSGSPAGPRRLAAAVDRLGPVVWQGYGQSESEMISLLTPEDIARRGEQALASVGRPVPDVEVSVRSADGRPVPQGQTGEIFVRSPHMMTGYWDDKRQTDEVLKDGWLDTRDLGYLDATGFLHLTGRSRDVIMAGGGEVRYAEPIERVLAGHPDVDQAYVVGAPDEHTGEEAIHAFVVANEGRTPDRQDLAKLVRTELGATAVPKTITLITDVPVTAGGKPDKLALLARANPPPS